MKVFEQKSEKQDIWFINELVEPFLYRFKYHFYGDKKTNKIEKPEWVLSFVQKLISEYGFFIQSSITPIVQQVMNTYNVTFINPSASFTNQLIDQVVKKMSKSIKLVKNCNDDQQKTLFIHIINELVAFERNNHKVDQSIHSVLSKHIITDDVLSSWIQQDKQSTDLILVDKLKNHKPHSSVSLNELKPGSSAHVLVQVMSLLNERYSCIQQPEARFNIFEKNILTYFHRYKKELESQIDKHLANVFQQEQEWINYCSMINSSIYVSSVLRDWCDLDHIISMGHLAALDQLADEYYLLADLMTRRMVTTNMLENFKITIHNKYDPSHGDQFNVSQEMIKVIEMMCQQLNVIHRHVQLERFNMVWRWLANDVDLFLDKHFYKSAQGEQVKIDMNGLIKEVFGKYTNKPLNFAPKTKKFLSL
ncbi:RAD50-interacting protein Rint [Acrasis kona]|uniref:RAD50-interacting protein Rint n=1 Tax=Acrasis kona TaxID=1008807 RepID=A0AAW2ZNG0_9EUKA